MIKLEHLEWLREPISFGEKQKSREYVIKISRELIGNIEGLVGTVFSTPHSSDPVESSLSAFVIAECSEIYENFLTKFPNFRQELESRVFHAVNSSCRREKVDDREKKIIAEFWKNHIPSTTTTIIGTLCLGPVAVISSLCDVMRFESTEKLLPIYASAHVIQYLPISQEAKDAWEESIAGKSDALFGGTVSLKKSGEVKKRIAEHIGLTIASTEFSCLGNKSLMDLRSWNEEDEFKSEIIRDQIISGRDLEENAGLRRMMHLEHVITGLALAVLNDPQIKNKFYVLIDQYLSRKQKILEFAVGDKINYPPIPQDKIPQDKVHSLCEYIIKYAHNEEAIKIARAAESDTKQLLKIWHIDFSAKNLTNFPPEIQWLSNLNSINLSSNALDSLPDWFREFKFLKSVDLRGNNFTSFPDILTEIPSLVRVHITGNPIQEVPSKMRAVVWELPFGAKWTD